ncbi:MAG: hypothetical protein IJX98_06715 [Clostridia bacterium]|nr:hypothetical protein [Clostridia bacterium]
MEKETRSEEDYALLYRQTGLTKIGIDGLLEEENIKRILNIQENYFAENEVISKAMGYGTYIEYVDDPIPLAKLENGDILVSACTFLSFFRFGHSALVVDGEFRQLLESYSYGVPSKVSSIASMNDLSTLMVLRPKCDEQTRERVVEYAKKELTGLPYDFFVGFFSEKYPETIKSTHCTHILWYAYKKFGIDLDSNGGGIVKPQDIANSDQLELVQVYGFDPQTLWS